jgi:hypothetical protein
MSVARELYPLCDMGVDAWVEYFGTSQGAAAIAKIYYDIFNEVRSAEEREAGIKRIGRRRNRASVPLSEVMSVVYPEQWNYLPIEEALKAHLGGWGSMTKLARAMNISQGHLSHLLAGRKRWDLSHLQAVADHIGKPPWYFVEWRAMWIGQLMTEALTKQPNLGVYAVKYLRDSRRKVDQS